MAGFWNTGIRSSYHLQEDTKTQQRTQEKSVERIKQTAFLLWREMSQHRNFDRSRHLWTTIHCTDARIEVWTGGSRNKARLIECGHGACWEKSRSINTSCDFTADPKYYRCWAMETRYNEDQRLGRNTIQTRNWRGCTSPLQRKRYTSEDGHCEVCLPWLKVHETLQENIDTVRKRCISTATRLLAKGR